MCGRKNWGRAGGRLTPTPPGGPISRCVFNFTPGRHEAFPAPTELVTSGLHWPPASPDVFREEGRRRVQVQGVSLFLHRKGGEKNPEKNNFIFISCVEL